MHDEHFWLAAQERSYKDFDKKQSERLCIPNVLYVVKKADVSEMENVPPFDARSRHNSMQINTVWVPTAAAILCQFGGRLVWCCRLCYRADKGDWTDVLFDEVANSLWTAQYHLSRWGVVWPVLLREARL